VTRRELLWLSGSGLIGAAGLRGAEPENLSYPLRSVDGTVTQPSRFFVRDHFAAPSIALESWRLRIEGRVERPYELTFSDLVESPATKIEAVLECAGNVAGGSAVSNGVWEGVPLGQLLARAKPAADAALVMLEGADTGKIFTDKPSLPYSQLVSLKECTEPQSMVAFKLNDLALPGRNGFPMRALFPGSYGMNSVKWLQRIVVLGPNEQNENVYKSGVLRLYNRVSRTDGSDKVVRLSSVQIKSAIAWPDNGTKLPAGRHTVWGFAWGGTGRVRRVAVSTDGGKVWRDAEFQSPNSSFAWVKWSYRWDAGPGEYAIMSRASDESGNEQPLRRDPARKDGYELNWCAPLHCSVG